MSAFHPPKGLEAISKPAAILLSATLAGCSSDLMDPHGPVGAAEKTILLDSLGIMLVIVVPTIIAIFAFAWWFRASNSRAQYRPDFIYSGRVELVTWSIPILVIIFLGGVTWVGSHELDPAEPLRGTGRPLTVEVVSLDWKWLFIYPEQGIASVSELVAPAGTPIHLKLTSASVMNTFFVPRLGSMIYTMNGMANDLYLQADEVGAFAGRSAHFSGDGFSDMRFTMKAVSSEDFAAWIARARSAGPALDAGGYAVLARQSSDVSPFTYRDVSPGLFDSIVRQHLAPGPGPNSGQV